MSYETETLAVPYAEGEDRPLTLLVEKPRGAGPFPAILDLHGGAWTYFGPEVDFYWRRKLARRGFLVGSADFRLAPKHPWPVFLEDVRAASRWLRAHGGGIGADTARIGVLGGSTGGHLAAMLAVAPSAGAAPTRALKTPDDADAHVDWAAPLWPILDVPGRYRMAKEARFDPLTRALARRILARRGGRGPGDGTEKRLRALDALRARRPRVGDALASAVQRIGALAAPTPLARAVLYPVLAEAHEGAFADIEQMEEASPLHVVRAGRAERLPPMLVVQGRADRNMTEAMTRAFADAYRAAGGRLDLDFVPGVGHSYGNIPSREADALVDRIAAFAREAAG